MHSFIGFQRQGLRLLAIPYQSPPAHKRQSEAANPPRLSWLKGNPPSQQTPSRPSRLHVAKHYGTKTIELPRLGIIRVDFGRRRRPGD
jgi:hypothetical protein